MGHEVSKEEVTEKDIDVIKSGWTSIESKEEFGLDIMTRLLLFHYTVHSYI